MYSNEEKWSQYDFVPDLFLNEVRIHVHFLFHPVPAIYLKITKMMHFL